MLQDDHFIAVVVVVTVAVAANFVLFLVFTREDNASQDRLDVCSKFAIFKILQNISVHERRCDEYHAEL